MPTVKIFTVKMSKVKTSIRENVRGKNIHLSMATIKTYAV